MFTKDIAFGEERFWIAEVTDHPASLLLAESLQPVRSEANVEGISDASRS